MDKEFVKDFAQEWIEAWNSHDLDKIMSHYAEDFEMSSPVITQITGEKSGTLKGKNAVRAYWEKALSMIPTLHFELLNSYSGVNSIIIQYKGHRGMSAEVFFFDGEGKVIRAYAHYE